MGGTQTKCSCGNVNTVEIVVTDKTKVWDQAILLDLTDIRQETGYANWITAPCSTINQTFTAYSCEDCSSAILEKLSKSSRFDHAVKRSEHGYFTTQLP